MRIRSYILGVALAAPSSCSPRLRSAHVTLQPEEAPAGGFTRLDVRVPTERDNASTTKVVVQFPPGFLSVSSEPVPGWNSEITMRKLDKPVEQFGEQVTEEVGQIAFTADGEGIGPGQFQDFGLSLGVPDEARLDAHLQGGADLQQRRGGAVDRAARLRVAGAAGEAHGSRGRRGAAEPAAQQPQAPAAEEDDDSGSDTLSIIALIVGGLGLVAGLAALLTGRRRAGVGAA